ncbi:hypothetical protein ACE38W_14975 [Chitinophaga sp. Hz27]|uniref:hypothetical protein n=1 Tax=Chitinophaga sp. Hz27 TaxID=3347169 RepID=UPI0035DEC97F
MTEQLRHFILNNPSVPHLFLNASGDFVTGPCNGFRKVLVSDLEESEILGNEPDSKSDTASDENALSEILGNEPDSKVRPDNRKKTK